MCVSTLKDSNGFKNNNKEQASYYKEFNHPNKKGEFRLSNHCTKLWTWIRHGYALNSSINVSICFTNKEEIPTSDDCCVDLNIYDENKNVIGSIVPFEVIQYVYDCNVLTSRDIRSIQLAFSKMFKGGRFIDPFKTNETKHAKVYKLVPNQNPTIIVENFDMKLFIEKRINEIIRDVINEEHYF